MTGLLPDSLRWMLPILVVLALAEMLWLVRRGRGYSWGESAASAVIMVGQRASGVLTALLFGGLYLWVWEHRLTTVPMDAWWALPLLFIGVEFFYYWQHRCAHESRWFWASHVTHHTPQHINLSAAYRLSWTSGITGHGFFMLPMVLLGYHPAAVFGMLAGNLLYQFWLHTEQVPRLGLLEGIFNTPANHRVHHASNPLYLDRNYGGVLVVFDRLFGTWQPELLEEPCRFGLTHQLETHNPLRIVFHEWLNLGRDLLTARSLREVAGYLFAAPGWRPDGSGRTTAVVRAELRARSQAPAEAAGNGLSTAV